MPKERHFYHNHVRQPYLHFTVHCQESRLQSTQNCFISQWHVDWSLFPQLGHLLYTMFSALCWPHFSGTIGHMFVISVTRQWKAQRIPLGSPSYRTPSKSLWNRKGQDSLPRIVFSWLLFWQMFNRLEARGFLELRLNLINTEGVV